MNTKARGLRSLPLPGNSHRAGWSLVMRTSLLLLAIGLIAAFCLFGAGSCKYSPEKTLKAASDAWASGDYQKSAELYERFLEHAPLGEESIQARLQLANIYYLNLHRYEDARVQYREFLSQAPSSPEAYGARERLAEVLSDLGKSYRRSPNMRTSLRWRK